MLVYAYRCKQHQQCDPLFPAIHSILLVPKFCGKEDKILQEGGSDLEEGGQSTARRRTKYCRKEDKELEGGQSTSGRRTKYLRKEDKVLQEGRQYTAGRRTGKYTDQH